MNLIGVALLLAILSPPSQAAIRYVSTAGNDANTGSSWTLAKATVQASISAAASGDEVWVAKGTYNERITLKDAVKLYGGFAGTETARAQRPSFPRVTPDPNETVLDGQKAGSVVKVLGVSSATTIDGFTIRNGKATFEGGGIDCDYGSPIIVNNSIIGNTAPSNGGGINCVSGSPTISNNTISGNSAYGVQGEGGGIYCWDDQGSSTISNNTISGNSAHEGAGIWYECLRGSPVIRSNMISGNAASGTGGGIYCEYGSPVFSNNTISGNTASDGAGISCYEGSPVISCNTISGNAAYYGGGGITGAFSSPVVSSNVISANTATDGGGIYFDEGAPVISNNTISGNTGVRYGGGIYCSYHSNPIAIKNNIIAFNKSGIYAESSAPALSHNNVYANTAYSFSKLTDPTGTNGNISADPKFISTTPGKEDYHLRSDSLCVNGGDNSAVKAGDFDIDGEPRISGVAVDIGADEALWYYAPWQGVKAGWNLVSVPITPTDPTPNSVFEGLDIANSSLLTWDNAQQQYTLCGPAWPGPVARGSAYWFLHEGADGSIRLPGYPGTTDYQLQLPAFPGGAHWIMFGAPFTTSVPTTAIRFTGGNIVNADWLTAYNAKLVESVAFGWDASKQTFFTLGAGNWDRPSVEPWYGYWLLIDTANAVTMTFPKP